jgi:hypothetical protein
MSETLGLVDGLYSEESRIALVRKGVVDLNTQQTLWLIDAVNHWLNSRALPTERANENRMEGIPG